MAEIHFRRDTAFRKQVFVPDSFAHPAKMDAQLLMWLVSKYTEPGETILDPMAGSGTTMLACMFGRNVVLVELEDKFCKMMCDNWELVKMKPQLGCQMGTCQIIQGDARNLEGILADKIITSPPYAEAEARDETPYQEGRVASMMSRSYLKSKTDNPQNIGNKPYGDIDSIITSPPFTSQLAGGEKIDPDYDYGSQGKYYAPIDNKAIGGSRKPEVVRQRQLSRNIGNINVFGNKGKLCMDSYLEAMLQVYSQCFKVLKDGGLMILVTKNFIRNKQVVRLDWDTWRLCEQAGFSYVERHWRKLPAQSFWRVIYHKKHPEVEQINYEDVLVFRK